MKGTNEILAASDRQSVAYAHKRSFLRAVIEVLAELKASRSSLTINMLRDRLDEYNRNDRHVWERITSPYHKRYPNLDHPSIKLQALPKSNTATKHPTASTQIPHTPSFYIKVSLDSPGSVSLAEWTSCFASANYPSDVKLHFYTEESLRNDLKAD
jgi:predicted membrane-bound mannosyltransferase